MAGDNWGPERDLGNAGTNRKYKEEEVHKPNQEIQVAEESTQWP